jgi:predicted ATPase
MEPLFLAVICGCNAGLFHEALHEVYIPRIQRGNASFAGSVVGARGALLSVLVHFFEHGNWRSPLEIGSGEQRPTVEDQLFILMQAGIYLTTTRGMGAPEARVCYERAESLCRSVNRPRLLYVALTAQWRYSLMTGKLTTTMQLADKVYSLAREQNDSSALIKACMALAATHYYSGNFESARRYAARGVQIWRSGDVESQVEELDEPAIACLCHEGLCAWHFGEVSSSHAAMAEAIALARELSDMHGLAAALYFAAILGHIERNPAEVERVASDLIALSTRQSFTQAQAVGTIFLGWARSASGSTVQGLSWIEDGIENIRARGGALCVPYFLTLKAEALHLADRISEARETIKEAETLVEASEERWWCAELYRLRGIFLTRHGGDEAQIEEAFRQAIGTAKEQKSISLTKRAEATYAEHRCQKASVSGHGFRLPLCYIRGHK